MGFLLFHHSAARFVRPLPATHENYFSFPFHRHLVALMKNYKPKSDDVRWWWKAEKSSRTICKRIVVCLLFQRFACLTIKVFFFSIRSLHNRHEVTHKPGKTRLCRPTSRRNQNSFQSHRCGIISTVAACSETWQHLASSVEEIFIKYSDHDSPFSPNPVRSSWHAWWLPKASRPDS